MQIDFPKTHDLDLLRTLLPEDWKTRLEPVDLAELSEWSVEARYPGDWPEVTSADADQAVALARRVIDLVTEDLRGRGFILNAM